MARLLTECPSQPPPRPSFNSNECDVRRRANRSRCAGMATIKRPGVNSVHARLSANSARKKTLHWGHRLASRRSVCARESGSDGHDRVVAHAHLPLAHQEAGSPKGQAHAASGVVDQGPDPGGDQGIGLAMDSTSQSTQIARAPKRPACTRPRSCAIETNRTWASRPPLCLGGAFLNQRSLMARRLSAV